MHTFTQPVEIHTTLHTARATELAAEAAAWRLAHEAAPAPAAPVLTTVAALRNRLGEALVAAGIRLMQPAHLHARVQGRAA